MGRIIGIDYGSKRVGLSVTDPLKIIATGLGTVHSKDIIDYLKKYLENEPVELFVLGDPRHLDNTPAQSSGIVNTFEKKLRNTFPEIPIKRIDERFTSTIAARSMIEQGMKKKDRQNKANIDEISAVLILQQYLETIQI